MYVDGFVVPVPSANRQSYIDHARGAVPMFKGLGATRMVEGWGDDVPDGTLTDFRGSVQAEAGEVVLFSWIEWPSRAVRDAGIARMMEDPHMKNMGDLPFDANRMIYGGFDPIVHEGDRDGGGFGYHDGYLVPVPEGRREDYRAVAETVAAILIEHGATRVVEAFGDDVPEGKLTDFRRAVKAEPGEAVIFSWVEWPSKEARAAGWEKTMADERMRTPPADMPFDGKRMIQGGFVPVVDL